MVRGRAAFREASGAPSCCRVTRRPEGTARASSAALPARDAGDVAALLSLRWRQAGKRLLGDAQESSVQERYSA